ncbi:MAG: hypothetical protein ING69_10560 [Rhodocyclaceae bacterium]|nr:hypothetical protein [Rhodocyclaceae bacterium]
MIVSVNLLAMICQLAGAIWVLTALQQRHVAVLEGDFGARRAARFSAMAGFVSAALPTMLGMGIVRFL